jgi:hypothetical protein
MLNNNRVLIASGVALVLAIVAALAWSSPNRFGGAVMAAAKAHDTLRLQQLIDFPAVADGMKADLEPIMAQAIAQRLAASGASLSAPLAARVSAIAQAEVDAAIGQMVDQLATPLALEQLADDKTIQVTGLGRQATPIDDVFPKDATGGRFRVARRYLAWDRFRFTLSNLSARSSVDIDLVRQGLFGWRVERVSPRISLADIQGGDTATAPAAGPASDAAPPPPPPPPPGEAPAGAQAIAAAGLPTAVGQCATTTVKEITTRLDDTPGSGSAVSFANGGYQVSYDQVPEVDESRAGDGVTMCLVSLPQDCPAGDDRGKVYKSTNLRTGRNWTLPDAEHMCGGA